MSVLYIIRFVNYIGSAFVVMGALGLVMDTFDFAFRFVNNQLVWRALLHGVFIPMGTSISTLVLSDSEIPSKTYSLLVSSAVALFIGCIGLTVGSYELAVITVNPAFFQRMGLYCLCVILGYAFIPLNVVDKIKVE